MTDTTELPKTLFTAVGVFQAGPGWNVEVAVPNFPTKDEAEAYAEAFSVMLVDGQLRRDDGKRTGIFDESWREVLDIHAKVYRVQASDSAKDQVYMPISAWQSAPGFMGDFQPISWRVEEDNF